VTTVFIVVGFSISAMAVGYLLGRLHQLLDIIEEDKDWRRDDDRS